MTVAPARPAAPAAILECGSGSDATLAAIAAQLRPWLPGGFALVAAGSDPALPIPDADRRRVAAAVPGRQADFIGGRWCAHRALALIGRPAQALPPGHWGGPLWPAGVVGSITHESARCLATAGPCEGLAGIGIDLCSAQRDDTVRSIASLVLAAGETAAGPVPHAATSHLQALFAMKEAVVKAVSHLAWRFLDLRDIAIDFDGRRFHARVPGVDGARVEGACGGVDGHAFAVAVARR